MRHDERTFLVDGWLIDHFESAVRSAVYKSGPFASYDDYNIRRMRVEDLKKNMMAFEIRQQLTVDDAPGKGKHKVWRWEMEGTVYTDLNLSWRFMLWRTCPCEYCKAFAYRENKRPYYEDWPSRCPKCIIQEYKAYRDEEYG